MSIREKLLVATTPRDRSRASERANIRQQYTIKGVDTDTLQLVRTAADQEGMKISSWISRRMKEAAERSLGSQAGNQETQGRLVLESSDMNVTQLADFMESVEGRLKDVERDIHQVMRVQRSLMAQLMERDLDR